MNPAERLVNMVWALNKEQLACLEAVVQTCQFDTIEQYTLFLQGLMARKCDEPRREWRFTFGAKEIIIGIKSRD